MKRRKNQGERDQYYIEANHPAIISREVANAVKEVQEYRKKILKIKTDGSYQNRYVFTGKIYCGECGSTFRRQKLDIGKTNERIIWTCHKHVEDSKACKMKAVKEESICQAFIKMWNKMYTNQGEIFEPFINSLKKIKSHEKQKKILEQLDNKIMELTKQSQILNQVMGQGYLDSAIFMEKQNEIGMELSKLRKERSQQLDRQRKSKEIAKTEEWIGILANQTETKKQFDEAFFQLLVDKVRIEVNRGITFCLYNGMELTE